MRPLRRPRPATGHVIQLLFALRSAAWCRFVVGVRAGVIAYRKSSEAVTFEALNLADGVPPSSKHVKLTGLALPSLKSQYTEQLRSAYLETYMLAAG